MLEGLLYLVFLLLLLLLVQVSQISRGFASGPAGEIPPRRIDREEVLEAGMSGRSAAYPVRLRSSVSWVIQVFSRVCFGDGCGVFSS